MKNIGSSTKYVPPDAQRNAGKASTPFSSFHTV